MSPMRQSNAYFCIPGSAQYTLRAHEPCTCQASSSRAESDNIPTPSRHRCKSLVPELYDGLSVSDEGLQQKNFPGRELCVFLPETQLSDPQSVLDHRSFEELKERASRLVKNARQNYQEHVSEATWEADFRQDVFGKVRNDDRLRIDKRPYEYLDVNPMGKVTVRKRTPDLTFGLGTRPTSPVSGANDARGWCETIVADFLANVDVELDNDLFRAHPASNQQSQSTGASLSSQRLRALSEHHQCGLIVDPRWGEADLVFPWAVYEVKKDTPTDTCTGKGIVDFQPAEAQIYQAGQMFLGMLDDLARNPDRVGEYQSVQSKQCQLFGFTSVANQWRGYVAFEKDGECHVETIWQGDVTNPSQALTLLYIIDQIHLWAVTQHRKFVTTHLLPWLARMDRLNQAAGGDANRIVQARCTLLLRDQLDVYYPEWQLVRKQGRCNSRSKDRNSGGGGGGSPEPKSSIQAEVSAAIRRADDRRAVRLSTQ